MTKDELYDLRGHGEVTKVQFKERIIDTYDVACELLAFSNYHGGQLVQGYRVGENGAGSGILRAMEDKPNVTFENRESAHEFVITIKREPAVDDQACDQASDQAGDQAVNQVANQVNNQVSNQAGTSKSRLTKAQKDIVNFCSIPRTAQEILDRVGLTNQSINRKRHIMPLVEMGVLEMTIPDNPTDPNQKKQEKEVIMAAKDNNELQIMKPSFLILLGSDGVENNEKG